MEKIIIKADDGFEISAAVFGVEKPKAVVQIVHGSLEHKERYYDFIKFLNEQGYAAIISDNRGHGESVDEYYPRGYMNGPDETISDLYAVTKYAKRIFPKTPLYMLGHSLGTLFARVYLQQHDSEIEKLVLSGTVNYNPFVGLGIFLAKTISLFKGKHGKSRLLNNMAAIKKDDSWISYSQKNLENYRKDPINIPMWQNGGALTVFHSDRELKKYKKFACKNPSLKILLVSGVDDPITGGKKGLKDTIKTLNKIGYKNTYSIVYLGMKHEILNEDENIKVYQDILQFLQK